MNSPSHNPLIFFGGAERDRTVDLLTASRALSQLSYSPTYKVKSEIPISKSETNSKADMKIRTIVHKNFYHEFASGVNSYFAKRRCLTISERKIAQATEVLKEEILPLRGIERRWSHSFLTRGLIPSSSPPITRTRSRSNLKE